MTPALLRYKQIKEENPNTVLLYRMGDFYEAFYEDAVTIARVLDIALTSRDKGPNKTPMAGIPYHALETYLGKLIDAGYKVAIAEQEEEKVKDEKSGKTKVVIHRNVARIVTPSTYDRETDANAHYLVSITVDSIKNIAAAKTQPLEKTDLQIALACIDPNGSDFSVSVFNNIQDLDNELFRINPAEILVSPELYNNILFSVYTSKNTHKISPIEKRYFNNQDDLLKHLKIKSLKACGLESEIEDQAAAACFNYLAETQHATLSHVNSLEKKVLQTRMRVDSNTLRNLEIVTSSNTGGTSLLQVLDHTHTRGGKRLLRDWITSPLADQKLITKRQDAVQFFMKFDSTDIVTKLDHIYDLERVCARLSYGTASPRDLVSLGQSIDHAAKISLDSNNSSARIDELKDSIQKSTTTLEKLQHIISTTLLDPAPSSIKDGHVIKDGFSAELDELRQMTQDNKKWLKNLEIMEQQKTGIGTLRVKYNRVFGYFIEVSRAQINKVPEGYIRKQTTVNGERYITTELKEKESMILGANDKIIEIECELYNTLLEQAKEFITPILELQSALSELDVYLSYATAAQLYNYCRPVFQTSKENNKNSLHAIDARHPVIERIIKDTYIYNDIHLDDGEMLLITGPNMGGKSTYIRMVALVTYLAHIGSYVPAKECQLGTVDSIFTRVGASDDLSRGESTFMVEMTEAANILRNATDKSLIILDEIGRGTSTYDGLSIAWAIVHYIHEKLRAKTLFATHYHELTVLEDELKRMSNYTVAISETEGNVVFLRKIEKGKAEKSFGIHVAKLAGLPDTVLHKATEILSELETKAIKQDHRQMGLWEFNDTQKKLAPKAEKTSTSAALPDPKYKKLADLLDTIDINSLTPLEALNKLSEIKKELK